MELSGCRTKIPGIEELPLRRHAAKTTYAGGISQEHSDKVLTERIYFSICITCLSAAQCKPAFLV